MAAEIESTLGVKSELIPSGGGCFEVVANGKLIFSKNELSRFPGHEEVLESLNTMSSNQ